MDAINQNKPKDNSKIQELLMEYENHKFPNNTDVPFPFSLNGKNSNIVIYRTFTLQYVIIHSRLQVQKQVAFCQNIFWELYL